MCCTNVMYDLPSNNFTMISNNVTLDTTLHPYAYKIFSLIIQEVTKQGTFYKQTIANRFGHCKNTFDKYWKQLKDKGYLIQVKKRDSKSRWTYEYTINSQPDQSQETLKNQQSHHIPKNDGLNEGVYSKTKSFNTYFSSSSKQPATDDRNSLLLNELSSRNISISKTSLTELSALMDTYGTDYINCIIDYCVDRGAKTYGYIKNTLKALMNKNIYTVEAFKESVKQHEEKKIKNRQLKEQRLEQSNLEMTKKLAYAPKTSNTTNASKKTRFNTMDSREWDFDELDRLEDEYVHNKVKAIEARKAKEAQKLYDSIVDKKKALERKKIALDDDYFNGDIEEQEFEKAMKEIDIELAELSKQQASINL